VIYQLGGPSEVRVFDYQGKNGDRYIFAG